MRAKLQAATLVEALVSLVLISLVLTAMLMLNSQVTQYETKNNQIHLESTCDSLFQEIKHRKLYVNNDIDLGKLNAEVKLSPGRGNSSYRNVEISLWREDRNYFTKQYLLEVKK